MAASQEKSAWHDSRAARGRMPRTPGIEGIWVLILGDLGVFGLFFATFSCYRAQNIDLYNVSSSLLVEGAGLTNTFVLLVSSLLAARACRSPS